MSFIFKEFLSAFIVLFAVIDILGAVPIIIGIKEKGAKIKPLQASVTSVSIMLVFLFGGEMLLGLFGVDLASFAIAGAFILLIMSLEMILGVQIFRHDSPSGASIVPIAFPLIAGAGSLTTLLSLRAEFHSVNIISALCLNIVIVYFVLRFTTKIEKILGAGGIFILKKFFGIILLAMAVRLFMSNIAKL